MLPARLSSLILGSLFIARREGVRGSKWMCFCYTSLMAGLGWDELQDVQKIQSEQEREINPHTQMLPSFVFSKTSSLWQKYSLTKAYTSTARNMTSTEMAMRHSRKASSQYLGLVKIAAHAGFTTSAAYGFSSRPTWILRLREATHESIIDPSPTPSQSHWTPRMTENTISMFPNTCAKKHCCPILEIHPTLPCLPNLFLQQHARHTASLAIAIRKDHQHRRPRRESPLARIRYR